MHPQSTCVLTFVCVCVCVWGGGGGGGLSHIRCVIRKKKSADAGQCKFSEIKICLIVILLRCNC